MRRQSRIAASTTVERSNSSVSAGAPAALPGKALAGEGTGSGGGGLGSCWEDAGSTNPTTPVIEGGTQDEMLGPAPGAASVSPEPSPLLLQQPEQLPTQQQGQEQQQRQQQRQVNGTGREGQQSRFGSRAGSRRMAFGRRSSGVLLADVARRVSRSFSVLSRGRSTSEQRNEVGGKKAPPVAASGSAGGAPGASAPEEATADKQKAPCTSNQNCSVQSGPTPDEATATHNTNGSGDADGTPPEAGGAGGAVKTRLGMLRSGTGGSTRKGHAAGKGGGGDTTAGGTGDRTQSEQQREAGEAGTVPPVGHQQAAGAAAGSAGESATGASQGMKSSVSNVAATASSSSARTQSRSLFGTGRVSGVGQRSRRASSVGGGGSNGDKPAGGGASRPLEPTTSSQSKKKFHIPHPHLPGAFRHKHQQELRRGVSGTGEPQRQQQQQTGDGSVVSGEEGGPGSGTAAAPSSGATAGAGGGAPAAPAAAPQHQSHLPLLHLSNLLHHHKGTPQAAAAEQQAQQTQQSQQSHHHLLPHLHLHHGGPGAPEPSAALDSGEDSMELLAQLHAAHERARDIVEKSRMQREQLLQRARAEVEEEAEALRREAALTFEAKQEKSEEQTEEACKAAAAAGDDVVQVDPAALMRASQLCVTETLKVGVHLPEDFRKRLCVIHQHPPTFFRKSCAGQYPSTRGLRDPAVLKAALHHAYCHRYPSNDKYYGSASYVDEGATGAYRGAALDTLGGGTGTSSVSDANREAYAAILGERGAWTEQDDEFRLDLREDALAAGGGNQRQSLLESVLSWLLMRSGSSSGDASSSSSGPATGGRKDDERVHDRRVPVTCNCWPIVSTDSS